jgi:hypothetical protein
MPAKYTTVTTSSLTAGERLYIQRRRMGWTVQQAAKRARTTVSLYRAWEKGRTESDIPSVGLGQLTPQEKCVIMRRRSGKLAVEVAAELGCCRLWLRQMENCTADVGRLLEYWRIR